MDPITGLSGMLDPAAFEEGTDAFGTKVSQEYLQIISKLNESITGLNEVAVDQIADEVVIASHTVDLADHETRVAANEVLTASHTVDIADHEVRITDNEDDIAALQGAVAVGTYKTSNDITPFDYATYGDYGIFNLYSPAARRAVVMQDPASSGWAEGARVYFVCSATFGAYLYSSSGFHPSGEHNFANMFQGDVIMATVVDDGSGTLMWSLGLMPKASSQNNCKVLTGAYSVDYGMEHTVFTNDGSGSYSVQLPEIIDSFVGAVIKGFFSDAGGGAITFNAAGSQYILSASGGSHSAEAINGNTGNSYIELTALPSANGAYRWGSSKVHA